MMQKLLLTISISILLISCKNPEKEKSTNSIELETPDMIAYAHGLEEWKKVSQIKFTFNVDRGDNHFERSWVWMPKTKDITLFTGQDTLSYNQNQMDSIATMADKNFINDKYWLLAPFDLAYNEGFTFTTKDSVTAPISQKTLQQLTVTYDADGGYTPGDAYDFFYNNDLLIEEWIFRKGNDTVPSVVTTWEDYKDFDGIKIATMHQNPERTFKLYFTNIEVEKE